MKKRINILLAFLLSLVFLISGCSSSIDEGQNYKSEISKKQSVEVKSSSDTKEKEKEKDFKTGDKKSKTENFDSKSIKEDHEYTDRDSVAFYIHKYKKLPKNYITKSEAKKLGWESSKKNLHEVASGKSIGGDRFSNREKILPYRNNEKYKECDIDYVSGARNAKRIVYSDKGDIYYTDDHYKTFTKLY